MLRYGENEKHCVQGVENLSVWIKSKNSSIKLKVKLGSYAHDTSYGQISKSESVRHFQHPVVGVCVRERDNRSMLNDGSLFHTWT